MDFSVYCQRRKASSEEDCVRFSDEKTAIPISERVRHAILSMPLLERIKIYDGPHYVGPGATYGIDEKLKSPRWLYVHYGLWTDVPHVGAGRVMIVERNMGEILYDGSDGME